MKYRLGDILNLKTQGVNTATDNIKYVNSGYKIIQAKNINRYNITFDDKNFVDENTFNRIKDNHKLNKGEVLFTNIGSQLGNSAIYDFDEKAIITWNVMKMIPNTNIINNYYLCYLLNFDKERLKLLNSSSTMPFISGEALMNFIFEVPEIEYQEKVVLLLNLLNNKIELNNKINYNLYEISKKLYKRWFIDFEYPNKEGKPYRSSEGKFIETEIGEIPEGWTTKRLDDISINFDSKRKPLSSREREERKGNIPYYGATSIIDYVDEYLFDGIYVLMGEDGTVINSDNSPILQYVWRKCWVNNHAHVLQGKGITTEHLMECLRNTDVSSIITGAVQLKINQANLNSLKYVSANNEVNKKFEEVLDTIYKKIRRTTEENETLGQLRDILLPKLMNGEINLENIKI
jgi:type I restriction enzyme S subunit